EHQGNSRLGRLCGRTPQALLLEKLFDPLKKQFNVPTCLIQTQDLLVAALMPWQRCNEQNPSGKRERIGMDLLLILARLALGPALGLVLLLLVQTQGDQAQMDRLSSKGDPDRAAQDGSVRGVQTFEPSQNVNLVSLLILHRKHAWGDTNNDVSTLANNK